MLILGSHLVNSALSIATSFRYHNPHSTQVTQPQDEAGIAFNAAWIAAAYPLTQGTFVLPGGRLGAVYGHKRLLTLGCIWWLVWMLGSGFANNVLALCFMRGLSGMNRLYAQLPMAI